MDERLNNARCIGLIRCSRKVQSKNSLPQQKAWLREFAEQNKMLYVSDMQEAVSASQIKKRPDIEKLFERKRIYNDFDTVIVQDLSRLTRGGVGHGLSLFFRFKDANIKLVSLIDGLIIGDAMISAAVRRFEESRATACASAMVMRRGFIAARTVGKVAYTAVAPYAIDRMITDEKGTPRFLIHKLRDTTTQTLSLDRSIVINHYKIGPDGERSRYVKQLDEIEEFVPGAPDEIKILNFIYRSYYIEKKGVWTIARDLNNMGLLGPSGRLWSDSSLRYILRNTIYLGIGYADRTTDAMFWMNGPSAPVPAIESKHPGDNFRSRKSWYQKSFKALENLLDFDDATKADILKWQEAELTRLSEKTPRKRGGDRHRLSLFFLKGVLRAKGDKQYCSSHSTKGKKQSKTYRSYKSPKHLNRPKSWECNNRSINAEAIESAMKVSIGDIIKNYDGLESAVIDSCHSYDAARDRDSKDATKLHLDRDKLVEQISYWIGQLSVLGSAVVDSKIKSLRESVGELDSKILQAEQAVDMQAKLDAGAARIAKTMKFVREQWDEMPAHVLNRVLKVLVGRMEIDMETFNVEIDIRIPSWVVTDNTFTQLCLENSMVDQPVFETRPLWTVDIAKITCKRGFPVNGLPTFNCSRSAARQNQAA